MLTTMLSKSELEYNAYVYCVDDNGFSMLRQTNVDQYDQGKEKEKGGEGGE